MNATYPQSPGVKTHAVETSQQAADEVQPRAVALRRQVLIILQVGPQTADEVAEALVESVLSIRPRLSELNAMGKIEATEERRLNKSGRSAVVWRIKSNGQPKQSVFAL